MSLPSLSSLSPSAGETDALCQATHRLSIVEIQQNESVDSSSDLTIWEALPQKARPAFDLVCSYLRTDEDCTDLANFSMVCFPFRNGVIEFMGSNENRSGLEHVQLTNIGESGLKVEIRLFPINLPLYDMSKLDWGRFDRSMDGSTPILGVTLTEPEDPVIEQVVDLLSSSIKRVLIGGHDPLITSNRSLAEQLLSKSKINQLTFGLTLILDDTLAAHILKMATKCDSICIGIVESTLFDTITFINELDSLPISSFVLVNYFADSSTFFGLPNLFWQQFFCQKLSNGSIEWVREGRNEKITEAPIDWSDTNINNLEWKKRKAT